MLWLERRRRFLVKKRKREYTQWKYILFHILEISSLAAWRLASEVCGEILTKKKTFHLLKSRQCRRRWLCSLWRVQATVKRRHLVCAIKHKKKQHRNKKKVKQHKFRGIFSVIKCIRLGCSIRLKLHSAAKHSQVCVEIPHSVPVEWKHLFYCLSFVTEQIRYRRTEWKQPLWRVLNTSSSNTNQLAVELKVYETFLRQSFHRFFSANAPRTETEKHTNSSAFRSTAKPRFSNISPTKVLPSPLDRAVNCQLRKQRSRSDLNTCWVARTLKRPQQRDHNQISIVQILCCHYPSRDYHTCALSADETSSVKTKCFCMKSSECVRRMKNLIIVICWTEQNRTQKRVCFRKTNRTLSYLCAVEIPIEIANLPIFLYVVCAGQTRAWQWMVLCCLFTWTETTLRASA